MGSFSCSLLVFASGRLFVSIYSLGVGRFSSVAISSVFAGNQSSRSCRAHLAGDSLVLDGRGTHGADEQEAI